MSVKLLDYTAALERLGGDEEFLLELLHELISLIDGNIDSIRAAVKNSDYISLKSIAHNIKGASANLNVSGMAHYFARLEEMAANEKLLNADEFISLIINDQKALKKFLEKKDRPS